MALSASTIFECNASATAGNVNSGGFNPANANMLTDGAATVATSNSPVFTSASYNFVANDVGHWIYIKSGTNWTAGWYKIASVAANAATLTATIGTAEVLTAANWRFSTNTVAGCATVASPSGATWTVDYSRATAAGFADTDLASTIGTTNPATVTSASHPFGKNMVGNLLHVTAGTSWTPGWYEIVSVSGTTATLDRAVGSVASLSSGTGKVGGAISLNATGAGIGDNAFFTLGVSSTTAAARIFFKTGSFTLGEALTTVASGSRQFPIIYEGYTTTRGDRPTIASGNMPTIAAGANAVTLGGDNDTFSISFTTTAASGIKLGAGGCRMFGCKVINSSTTAARAGVDLATGAGSTLANCEVVSYRGNAVNIGSGTAGPFTIINNYLHDSDQIINLGNDVNTPYAFIMQNLIVGFVTTGIKVVTGTEYLLPIIGNTIYGTEAKRGTGVSFPANMGHATLLDNIVYGCTTGISAAETNASWYTDYNDFFNNTNDTSSTSQFPKGANEQAVTPQFTSVAELTGTTATTTAGNHLVQSGATFIASGVTAGRDYLYISGGTGVTAGIYGILSVDSATQITTDITLTANATADKVWSIRTGQDFSIGTNLKGLGTPGAFPAGLTTSSEDIGAVSRVEAGMIRARSFGGM